ncbi:hypothetical protein LCGC14_2828950 [marine sediment metagenome]|uniref:Uncharacterized protein n=1 Tax=marine sediment metagenome TaxID=412755 RepID=A0A0F9B5T4_9ZZZZ
MPGIWDEGGFKESGYASIKVFDGNLTEVSDDVEGKFGTQKQFVWTQVELIEAGDDVVLENQEFTQWLKQSGGTGSLDEHMVKAFAAYKEAQGLEGRLFKFEFLVGVPTRWERQIVEYSGKGEDGKPMAPGSYWAPVAPAGSSAPAPAITSDDTEDADPEISVPQKVIDAAAKYAGEGATETQIKQAFNKKKAGRDAITAAGGISTILAATVEAGLLVDDDGVYSPPSADDSESEDEDIL